MGETVPSASDYQLLFDASPRPMWVYDVETLAFLAVNEAAIAAYGYSRDEFLAMTIADIRPAEDVPALLAAVARSGERPTLSTGWRHRKKDGSVIAVEISSCPLVFGGRRAELVLPNDVSERLRLEEQLRQAQKMEAVGRLAGGIAHDFNNLLTAILGYSEIGLLRPGLDDQLRHDLEEIHLAGERATTLTRQLLTFSRKQLVLPQALDLGVVVVELSKMLRRLIGEDVELETLIEPGALTIKADRGQVEQVLMNLSVNARDAMPAGGRLSIEVCLVHLDAAYAQQHVDVPTGEYVMLAVTDTGIGMDAETRRHLFEPFFTTKESGTGLGLATAYGIVKSAGGSIWVYTELGRGTTFKVYFPRLVGDRVETATVGQTSALPVGTETVLLLEDDHLVRAMVERILQGTGYQVLASATAAEAEEVLRRAGQVELVVTDVVLPDLGGRPALERLRAVQPDLRVLFMSGYTDDTILRGGYLPAGADFLQKPFTPLALARKVREVLDRPPPAPATDGPVH
jgi:PAS domain S-box-containing protein